VFLFPFGCYFLPEHLNGMTVVVALWLVASFLTPPMGFLRPHPYSDIPSNRPLLKRK
jgi:hypothetical protein